MIYAAVSVINTSMLSIFPMRFADTGNVSSVSGIMDLVTYSGAGVGSFVYGFTTKSFGYDFMFESWVVISVVSLVIVMLINKKTAFNQKNSDTNK